MIVMTIGLPGDPPSMPFPGMAPVASVRTRAGGNAAGQAPVPAANHRRTGLMGKPRKQHPRHHIFENNPFIDGLLAWMDSPDGQQSIALCDILHGILEDVTVDARQRRLIWPDAQSLDIAQSVLHIQKQLPDFPRDKIEDLLIDWLEAGYAPEHYSDAQLDELDRLTERWIAGHLRRPKASKRKSRTRHS
jgi:hypothetical protein